MLQYAVPPGYQRQQPIKRPKLGPWLGVIDAILDEDKSTPAKQRHTAKRIFERLREEHDFTGGYTIVKDYVHTAKLRSPGDVRSLTHAPGEAQADFGEAWVVMAGVKLKAHFLAMDLPHSDDCFVSLFLPRRRRLSWKAMCEPLRTSAAFPRGFFTTTRRSRWPEDSGR
jgi:transposase